MKVLGSRCVLSGVVLQMLVKHRKLLNAFIRQTPSLLDSAFKLVRDNYPKMLDFDNKRTYFNNRLRRENKEARREQVWSLRALCGLTRLISAQLTCEALGCLLSVVPAVFQYRARGAQGTAGSAV